MLSYSDIIHRCNKGTVITSNIYARWHHYFQRPLNGVQLLSWYIVSCATKKIANELES